MSLRIARFALAMLAVLTSAPVAFAGVGLDMSALWPNTDGLGWTYAQHTEDLEDPPSTTDRVLRLLLEGTAVAPNGIDVQVLRGQLLSGPVAAHGDADAIRDPFMRSLLRARPELRPAIEAASPLAACPGNHAIGFDALMLGGDFAYRKTASEIAAWRCSAADTRAWIWLVSNLTLGNQFQLQLIPDLASDVILTGTMAAIENVTVPAGTFPSCLRVDYVVDYGLAECTDNGGTPQGTYRSRTRGSVYYASGIGPVKTTEEFVRYDEMTGTCAPPSEVGQPQSRVTMQLVSLPVPVAASTWGRIKTLYR